MSLDLFCLDFMAPVGSGDGGWGYDDAWHKDVNGGYVSNAQTCQASAAPMGTGTWVSMGFSVSPGTPLLKGNIVVFHTASHWILYG